MSRPIFWISSCGSNAGMEMTAPVVNAIANNALFHSNLHISQTPPQIIHILRFCLVDSIPRFCNRLCWGQDCSMSRKFIWVVLYYCTFWLEAQNFRVDTARRKDNDQQIHKKWCDIAAYITNSVQMFEDSNNPVY